MQFRLLHPAEFRKTAIERLQVIASVELFLLSHWRDDSQSGGQFILGDQVAAAERHGIDTQIGGGDVEQAFAKEVALEAAGSAVGAGGSLVGDQHGRFDVDVRNAIGSGEELDHIARSDRGVGADVGADVAVDVTTNRQDGAVAPAEKFKLAVEFAGVVAGHHVFAAILDPFHRTIEVTGGERDQEIFRVELAAHAEATADIAFDEVDGGFRQTDLLGQHAARGERNLCGAVDSQVLFLAVPRTDEAARLHGRRGVALGVEALAADIEFVAGRGGERGIGVTKDGRVGQRKVGARFLEQQRLVGGGGPGVDAGRQRLDLDGDQLQRILGDRGRFGDHNGDGLADIAHLAAGDHRLFVGHEIAQRDQAQRDGGHRVADLGGGEDRGDTRQRQRRCRVHVQDPAVRDGTAQDRGVEHAIEVEIIDELAAAAQQAQILDAFDGLPDVGIDDVHATALRAWVW